MKNIVYKQVSNYGTSHPVYARLLVQTRELLQWADLSKDKQDRLFTIYNGLKKRLLNCHELYDRLIGAANETLKAARSNPDGSHKRQPFLIDLEHEAEAFLYKSKDYFRDLVDVLKVFFPTIKEDRANAFYNASGKGDGKLTEWASRQFGSTDSFTDMLRYEQAWMEELIRKRNAAEHPSGHSGILTIENFQPGPEGVLVPPSWHRDGLPATSILADINAAMDDMLTLAEDILIACIMKTWKFSNIEFAQIPEKDRNPNCPIRIKVQLRREQ
jgi:hypothetical protein